MKPLTASLAPLLAFTLAVATGSAKSIKLHGYVTEIRTQHSFDIDDYRVSRDNTVSLEFEKDEDSGEKAIIPEDVRIGTEVEIKGDYDAALHQLTAKSIKVFPSETRKVKRTALLEQQPQMQKRGTYWEGTIRVDGQSLLVDEQTNVSVVPNKTQSKAQKNAKKAAQKAAKAGDPAPNEAVALTRLDEIHPNMYVSYEGIREKAGTIRAAKLEFKDNEMTSGEAKLWKSLTPKVSAFKNEKPGELRIGRIGKFKTVPDKDVQEYVQKLGESLIPANQKNLAATDQNRIPFQFHVIEQKHPNAFAVANGTVVVHSSLLPAVENEAQLAFILGHELAHATQEHTLRQLDFHKKKRIALQIAAIAASAYGAYSVRDILNMVNAAIVNGYSRHLENQADRLGMEYMLAAGYDPREAPRAWKAMTLKQGDAPTNFFWSSHDSNATRRSYLMAELRNNYAEAQFASTKRDSEDFHRIAGIISERQKPKIKVKVTAGAASGPALAAPMTTAAAAQGSTYSHAAAPAEQSNDTPSGKLQMVKTRPKRGEARINSRPRPLKHEAAGRNHFAVLPSPTICAYSYRPLRATTVTAPGTPSQSKTQSPESNLFRLDWPVLRFGEGGIRGSDLHLEGIEQRKFGDTYPLHSSPGVEALNTHTAIYHGFETSS